MITMKPAQVYHTTALFFMFGAQAHMTLRFPVPFQSNNSPLDSSGADFPCKPSGGAYRVDQVNQWRAGETKLVNFKGSAVHGGGSCQFSLTTDETPTKQSQWKVIHSIIGGCPSNVSENLPTDPDGSLAATFPVTLPRDTPNGAVTFAWSWLNKKGLREFYMSCAPLMVSGGTEGRASSLRDLPDMFVANLPSSSCGTLENFDFAYPNPGKSVITGESASANAQLTGDGCATMTRMGAGAGELGPVHTNMKVASSTATATTEARLTGERYANQGSLSTSTSTSIIDPYLPVVTGSCIPCSRDGTIICIGSAQFGLCENGCAIAQNLAAGTSCSAGTIV